MRSLFDDVDESASLICKRASTFFDWPIDTISRNFTADTIALPARMKTERYIHFPPRIYFWWWRGGADLHARISG